jgi:hypothetical protein
VLGNPVIVNDRYDASDAIDTVACGKLVILQRPGQVQRRIAQGIESVNNLSTTMMIQDRRAFESGRDVLLVPRCRSAIVSIRTLLWPECHGPLPSICIVFSLPLDPGPEISTSLVISKLIEEALVEEALWPSIA